jgi:hypothetical protein
MAVNAFGNALGSGLTQFDQAPTLSAIRPSPRKFEALVFPIRLS